MIYIIYMNYCIKYEYIAWELFGLLTVFQQRPLYMFTQGILWFSWHQHL